jgi:hypothetical protein
MMIVWGAKGEVANLGPQASRHCPTCEKERPFHVILQYTVRHIWYVFKWVTGKQYVLLCDVCQRGNKLDPKLVESRLTKPPIPFATRWGWAFLAGMVAIAAVFGVLDDSIRSTSREAYLAAPRKGDRYVVNVASLLKTPQSKYMYGVLRVRAVNAGSVEFDAPSIFYAGPTGPTKDIRDEKLDAPGYFSPAPISLSRDEIARIHKEHAIHSIERGAQASLAAAP